MSSTKRALESRRVHMKLSACPRCGWKRRLLRLRQKAERVRSSKASAELDSPEIYAFTPLPHTVEATWQRRNCALAFCLAARAESTRFRCAPRDLSSRRLTGRSMRWLSWVLRKKAGGCRRVRRRRCSRRAKPQNGGRNGNSETGLSIVAAAGEPPAGTGLDVVFPGAARHLWRRWHGAGAV